MKVIKDREYNINFDDKEYVSDILIDFDITPEELCYQLTAYEKDGVVNFEKGIKDVLSDEISEPSYNDFYEFLDENDYERIFDIDEFDEMESGEKPFEIAQKTFYGDFNPGYHKYFTYDGNGNYKGYETLSEAMDDHSEFYDWYYGNKLEDLLTDEDFKSEIVKGTLQLVKQGY